MDTKHLEYIVEVAKSGSVNKAAKNLYISQSNLSSIIKNTEGQIGYTIFARSTSGIHLTQEGKLFIHHAEEILTGISKIKKVPEVFGEKQNLSIISSRASFLIHCYFEFNHKFPCNFVQDTFLGAGLKENYKAIIAQRCRLGILVMFKRKQEKYALLAERYNLNFTILKNNIPMMVFMSKKHPLAKQEYVDALELSKYPFVTDADIDYDDTLEVLNIDDKSTVLYTCDNGSVFDAVRKGQYISIGINIAPGDANLLNCICRPVKNAEAMSICLIKNKDINLSAREQSFISYLTDSSKEYYSK